MNITAMSQDFKPGDKISCVVEQQLPNCLLVRFHKGKGSNQRKVFRGVLVDESAPITKRNLEQTDASVKPILTKELATTFIKEFQSPHISGKFLRNKNKPGCLVLDDFYIDYHKTNNHEDEKEERIEVPGNQFNQVADQESCIGMKKIMANQSAYGKNQGLETKNNFILNEKGIVDNLKNGSGIVDTTEQQELGRHISKRKGKPRHYTRSEINNDIASTQEQGQRIGHVNSIEEKKRYSKRNRAEKPKRFFGSEFDMHLNKEKKSNRSNKKKDFVVDKQLKFTENSLLESNCMEQKSKDVTDVKKIKQRDKVIQNDTKYENYECKLEDSESSLKRSPRLLLKRSLKAVSPRNGNDDEKERISGAKRRKLGKAIKYVPEKIANNRACPKMNTGTFLEKDVTTVEKVNIKSPVKAFEVVRENKERTSANHGTKEENSNGNLVGKTDAETKLLKVKQEKKPKNSPSKMKKGSKDILSSPKKEEIKRKVHREKKISNEDWLEEGSVNADMLLCHEPPFDEPSDIEAKLREKRKSLKQAERILKGKVRALNEDDVAIFACASTERKLHHEPAEEKKFVMLDLKEAGIFDDGTVKVGSKAMKIEVSALNVTKNAANGDGCNSNAKGIYRMTIPNSIAGASQIPTMPGASEISQGPPSDGKAVKVEVSTLNAKGKRCQIKEASFQLPLQRHHQAPQVSTTSQAPQDPMDTSVPSGVSGSQPAVDRKVYVVPEPAKGKYAGKKKGKDPTDDSRARTIIIDKSKGTVSISTCEKLSTTGDNEQENLKKFADDAARESCFGFDDGQKPREFSTNSEVAALETIDSLTATKKDIIVEENEDEPIEFEIDESSSTDELVSLPIDDQEDQLGASWGKSENLDTQSDSCFDETCSETDDVWEGVSLPQTEFDCLGKLSSKYASEKDSGTKAMTAGDCSNNTATSCYAQISFKRLVESAHAEKMKAKIAASDVETNVGDRKHEKVTLKECDRYKKIENIMDPGMYSVERSTQDNENREVEKIETVTLDKFSANDASTLASRNTQETQERNISSEGAFVESRENTETECVSKRQPEHPLGESKILPAGKETGKINDCRCSKGEGEFLRKEGIEGVRKSDKMIITRAPKRSMKMTARSWKNPFHNKAVAANQSKCSTISAEDDSSHVFLQGGIREALFKSQSTGEQQTSRKSISGLTNMERKMKGLKYFHIKIEPSDSPVLEGNVCFDQRYGVERGIEEEANTDGMEMVEDIVKVIPAVVEERMSFGFDFKESSIQLSRSANSHAGIGEGKVETEIEKGKQIGPAKFDEACPPRAYTKLASENIRVKVLQFGEKQAGGGEMVVNESPRVCKIGSGGEDEQAWQQSNLCDKKWKCRWSDATKTQCNERNGHARSWKSNKRGLRKYPVVGRSWRGRGHTDSKNKGEFAKFVQNMVPRKHCLEGCESDLLALKKATIAREQGEELLKQMYKLNKGLLLNTEPNQISRKGETN